MTSRAARGCAHRHLPLHGLPRLRWSERAPSAGRLLARESAGEAPTHWPPGLEDRVAGARCARWVRSRVRDDRDVEALAGGLDHGEADPVDGDAALVHEVRPSAGLEGEDRATVPDAAPRPLRGCPRARSPCVERSPTCSACSTPTTRPASAPALNQVRSGPRSGQGHVRAGVLASGAAINLARLEPAMAMPSPIEAVQTRWSSGPSPLGPLPGPGPSPGEGAPVGHRPDGLVGTDRDGGFDESANMALGAWEEWVAAQPGGRERGSRGRPSGSRGREEY